MIIMNSLCYINIPGRSTTLPSGIILSCKPAITSSAASFAESTDGVQCIYPIT